VQKTLCRADEVNFGKKLKNALEDTKTLPALKKATSDMGGRRYYVITI